tara:strand:- start:227 stop:802 length:576 start_codon:yes stop_codon:yes gene_type:complete
MKKGRLKEIVSELQGASKMHLKQSKEIEKHIEDMKAPTKQVTVGDAIGFAGNFIKGAGGVFMSMLSTNSAHGGSYHKDHWRDQAFEKQGEGKGPDFKPVSKEQFNKNWQDMQAGNFGSLLGSNSSRPKPNSDFGEDPVTLGKTETSSNGESVAKAKYKCWKGYKAKGKKKSPSGKRTKSGKIKMVNNCVKK